MAEVATSEGFIIAINNYNCNINIILKRGPSWTGLARWIPLFLLGEGVFQIIWCPRPRPPGTIPLYNLPPPLRLFPPPILFPSFPRLLRGVDAICLRCAIVIAVVVVWLVAAALTFGMDESLDG